MFNMRVGEEKKNGFELLKKLSDESMNGIYEPVAIVCGGDGTVMWVVS